MDQIEIIPLTDSFLCDVVTISEKSLYETITEKMLREFLQYDYNVFYVAYDKNESGILGFVGTSYTIDEGELLYIAVDPSSRRQGIGQKLLNRVFSDMEKKDICRLLLEVRESNKTALEFYEKNDFRTLTVRKSYYTQPEEDGIIMEKIITQ